MKRNILPRPSSLSPLTSYILLLTSYLLLAGCEYKELCYDHDHWATVRVVFDWSQSPEAEPTGMTVLFYPAEGEGEPVRYDFAGKEGGTARLDPGTYRAVCYNNNTETILYRYMTQADALEAYTRRSSIEEGTKLTRSGMPRAASTEDEPVILEPDPLWAAASEPFTLQPNDRDILVTLTPTPRYEDVYITIHDVPNLQYTGQFGGALSGLAPSIAMASGTPADGTATQAFTCRVVDGNTLKMHFRTFGHCPHSSEGTLNEHLLTVYAILADGSRWYYTQNVTDKMHKGSSTGEKEHHIDIDIDGLPVPKPIVNGSGFQPTIDSWQGEEIEVGM